LKKLTRGKKKYFTEEEFWETISPRKIFNFDAKIMQKEYEYKSGAVYNGSWKGGFRHGYGVM